jgi:hypothetical protein
MCDGLFHVATMSSCSFVQVGVCFDVEPGCLLLELMANGDLRTYLRAYTGETALLRYGLMRSSRNCIGLFAKNSFMDIALHSIHIAINCLM